MKLSKIAGLAGRTVGVKRRRHEAHLDALASQRHTPGPWTWDGPPDNIIVWSSPEDRVCFLTSNGPTEANARLIALAPELYEYVASSASNGCATAQALVARVAPSSN